MLMIFCILLVTDTAGSGSSNITIGYLCALFVISTMLILLSFILCCGLVTESQILLGTFSCVGLLLFLVEVGALVYVKVYDQSFMTFVDDKFMDVSRMDLPSAKLMDFIQSTWECCGKNGPADWGLNIPSSCCTKPVTIGCNNTVSSLLLPAYNGHFYKQGCQTMLKEYAKSFHPHLVAALICVLVVQISSTILSGIVYYRARLAQSTIELVI